jgi:hypothetical protein
MHGEGLAAHDRRLAAHDHEHEQERDREASLS